MAQKEHTGSNPLGDRSGWINTGRLFASHADCQRLSFRSTIATRSWTLPSTGVRNRGRIRRPAGHNQCSITRT